MKFWLYVVGLLVLAFSAKVIFDDAREHVKSAQAEAWYRQEQAEDSATQRDALRAFKDCVQDGNKVRDCMGELE